MKNRFRRLIGILQSLFIVITGCSSQKAQTTDSSSEADKVQPDVAGESQNIDSEADTKASDQIIKVINMDESGNMKIDGKALGSTYEMNVARAKRSDTGNELSVELLYETPHTKWEVLKKGDSVAIDELEAAKDELYFIEPGHLKLQLKAVKPGETSFSFYNRKTASDGDETETGFVLKVVVDENNVIVKATSNQIDVMPAPVAVRPGEQDDGVVIADSEWKLVNFDNINGYYKFAKNRLVIDVKENLSTGFSWAYAIEGKTVKTVSDSHNAPQDKDHRAGAPGRRVLEFKGLAEGSTDISFANRRPWEDNSGKVDLKINVVTDSTGNIIDVKRVE